MSCNSYSRRRECRTHEASSSGEKVCGLVLALLQLRIIKAGKKERLRERERSHSPSKDFDSACLRISACNNVAEVLPIVSCCGAFSLSSFHHSLCYIRLDAKWSLSAHAEGAAVPSRPFWCIVLGENSGGVVLLLCCRADGVAQRDASLSPRISCCSAFFLQRERERERL